MRLSPHHPNLNRHPAPGVGVFFQGADAGFEGEVAVEHEGGGLVLVGGDVAEFAAVPVDADGMAVVRVVGFAMQFDAVADG